jgi:hypothetical protein
VSLEVSANRMSAQNMPKPTRFLFRQVDVPQVGRLANDRYRAIRPLNADPLRVQGGKTVQGSDGTFLGLVYQPPSERSK